jgi:hypothetical protein
MSVVFPRTQEAEAGGSRVQGHTDSKTPSQRKKHKIHIRKEKKKRFKINYLNFLLKKLEKDGQI